MEANFDSDRVTQELEPPRNYALSGKIMLTAIVVLLAVVIFMVALHIYARWYLLRVRRRQLQRRSRRRTHLVFYVDQNNPHFAGTDASVFGLDASVLRTLPVFAYSPKTHTEIPECAVCLSEFEENEKVRLLPKCNHSFHLECIDMWFHSHSTCPLCRSPVENPQIPDPAPETRSELVLSIPDITEPDPEPVPGPSSGMFGEQSAVDPSPRDRRKGLDLMGLTIERILSINRRSSPISPTAECGGGDTEMMDIERGRDESRQSSRAQTPR